MSTHCSTEQQLLHIIYFLDQSWLKTPELINIFSIQLFKKSGLIFILFLFLFCLYPPNGFGCVFLVVETYACTVWDFVIHLILLNV